MDTTFDSVNQKILEKVHPPFLFQVAAVRLLTCVCVSVCV